MHPFDKLFRRLEPSTSTLSLLNATSNNAQLMQLVVCHASLKVGATCLSERTREGKEERIFCRESARLRLTARTVSSASAPCCCSCCERVPCLLPSTRSRPVTACVLLCVLGHSAAGLCISPSASAAPLDLALLPLHSTHPPTSVQ